MKIYIITAVVLAALSTTAMAETVPTPSEPSQVKEMPDPMRGKRNMKDRMWKEMDADSDGVVTKEESAAFGNRKFEEKDADHDGKVTKEEWDAFRKAKMEERKAKMKNKMESMNTGEKTGEKKPEMSSEPKK